jgi:hypothetical protein
MRLHAVMCEEVQRPPAPAVIEFVEELTRRHGIDSDDGFLSTDIEADVRGVVLCTWWETALANVGAVLELTKDTGLAVLDVQTLRLFDPRGAIPLAVTLGDGTPVPYLSPSLLNDLVARPHPRYPFFVVKRVEQQYIQVFIQADGLPAILEYRAGSAEQHHRAETSDRDLVRDVVWAWANESAGWDTAVAWQPLNLGDAD